MGTIILSAIVAHTGWHWMMDRFAAFRQYDLSMPQFTPALVAELLRYAMAIVALAGIMWLISLLFSKGEKGTPAEDPART